jgi:putative transposase
MPQLRHYDHQSTVRFVTFSTYRFVPALQDDRAKNAFIAELKALRSKYRLRLLGYVLMPDHVHLVLDLPDHLRLGRIIGELKSLSARRYFSTIGSQRGHQNVLWQKRCYDHNCRTPESVVKKVNYCHNNPVRRGMVSEPGDWLWSSYNWYSGRREVPIEIDEVETSGVASGERPPPQGAC